MKKIISLYGLLLFLIGGVCKTSAQQLVYYQEDKVYTIEPETRKKTSVILENTLVLDDTKLTKTDHIVYQPEQLSATLKLPEGNYFYQGLQSSHNTAIWIFTERDMIGTGYRMWKFNTNTGKRDLLFENAGGPNPELQFVPIAWSNDADIIYLEAIDHFDSENLHEGIYRYDLKNSTHQKLAIKDHYISTPLLSPDRNKFAYSASFESGKNRDLLHGKSERLLTYDVKTRTEKIIVEQKGSSLVFAGWVSKAVPVKKLLVDEKILDRKRQQQSIQQKMAVSMKLPWESGISYCVTRAGTPAPTGPRGSSSKCSSVYERFDPHSYVAIDFDSPNGVRDNVLASAAGTVTFTRTTDQGGYGKYVIITHSDNSRTLYAHLSRVYVRVGDCVGQGNPIGDGGTTGSSTGDHIHFEKRVGGTLVYPVFSECNCTPRQAYRYTSGNQRTNGCGPSCEPDRTVSGTISSGTYTSSSTITGSGVINTGSTVVFDTKNEIYLVNGFEAKNNSVFETRLGGGCATGRSVEINKEPTTLAATSQNFRVYPNPSRNTIYIDGITKNEVINIYDLSGRLLIKKVASDTREQLDIKHLLQGMYIVKVGTKATRQLLKTN